MTFARNIFLVLEGVEKKLAFVSVLQKDPQAGTHPFGNKTPLKVGGTGTGGTSSGAGVS